MSHNIITAEDLLKKMRMGTKEVHEIKMRDFVVPVRVLSITEMNDIRRDAIKQAVLLKGDDVDKNVHIQKLTLKLASTISRDDVPLLSDKLLGMMTLDEVNYLYNEYIRINEVVNPSLEQISSEKFKEVVTALKKNMITSGDCSLPLLRVICTAYADVIRRQENQTSHTVS